jgi:hypothetical protein
MAEATIRGAGSLSGIGDDAGNCARAGEKLAQASTRLAAHTGIDNEQNEDISGKTSIMAEVLPKTGI